MPMTEEARAAQSAKMKASWAARKASKENAPPKIEAGRMSEQAIQEAMAKTPMNAVAEVPQTIKVVKVEPPPPVSLPDHIDIEVDWDNISMLMAQQFYAHLKSEFERAGRILNARSMSRLSGFECFMCHRHFPGDPKFSDHSYIDPKTGLSPRVDCCGELCVINYNAMRINERHEKDVQRAKEERG